jgi:ATP-dependent helicase HrpB
MSGGRSSQLHRESIVQNNHFLVASELEENKTPTGVQLFLKKVTAIDENWIYENKNINLTKNSKVYFDAQTKKVIKSTGYTWNGLTLKREISEPENADEISEILANSILEGIIDFPQWNEDVEHYILRVNFSSENAPHYEIPPIDSDAKHFIIQQTIYGINNTKEILRCNPWPALKGWLSYEQQEAVNLVAPESIELPHRHRPVKLRYCENGDVVLSETIQALYDCPLPITVAEGKVSVIFELLAPSRRPVQITRDLDYFWKNSYHDIKKELKGRYPKHEWR